VTKSRRDELLEQFIVFYTAHPEVWRLFNRRSTELSNTRTKYSGKAIMEDIRWKFSRLDHADRTFKINDKFTAFYVRLWMIAHPDRAEFFSIRRQRSSVTKPTGKSGDAMDHQLTLEDLFDEGPDADLGERLALLLEDLPPEGPPA